MSFAFRLFPFLVPLALALVADGCGSDASSSDFDASSLPNVRGDGGGPSFSSDASSPDGRCGQDRTGILRDFRGTNEPGGHPDFEFDMLGPDKGIVATDLGPNLKPVYNAVPPQIAGTLKSTHGQEAFDQWYRDVPGVNKSMLYNLPLKVEGGKQVFDSTSFFPLDGLGWGNTPNAAHNYHFTFELHTEFEYRGGEVFQFRGDDDVWVFLNKKLAIDIGGIKPAMEESVDLDAKAQELGIEVGKVYSFDFFFAERHRNESNFRMETTLQFVNCDPILPK